MKKKPRRRRSPQPQSPLPEPHELKAAYDAGYANGMLPETMDPSDNPFAWVVSKRCKALACTWETGWADGADEFCKRRDSKREPIPSRDPVELVIP